MSNQIAGTGIISEMLVRQVAELRLGLQARSKKLFIFAFLGSTVLSGCVAAQQPIAVEELTIDVPESRLISSPETFAFAEHGHFGDKVQFDGRRADSLGGAYAVHLRGGRIFGIEVKYPQPITRDQALVVFDRLVNDRAAKLIEHDNADFVLKDCKYPCEIAYYSNGVRFEAYYANNAEQRIKQLSVFR